MGCVWAVCARVWHYSSFKYRILDCLTGSNFIMPQSQTGGDKSQRRASGNLSRLRDKTGLRRLSFSAKLGRTKEVLNMKAGVFGFSFFVFLKWRYEHSGAIASRYFQLGVLWRNLATVKSTLKRTEPRAIITTSTLLKVSYISTVLLWTCFFSSVRAHVTTFPWLSLRSDNMILKKRTIHVLNLKSDSFSFFF